MSIGAHIKISLELPTMIVARYLEDLSDEDILVRPAPAMNHIAWQLGHLIISENFHINQVVANSMPKLDVEFSEKHTPETAASDNPADFLSKAQYLQEMTRQRNGTLQLLSQLTDERLLEKSPDSINYFGPTVGAVFAGEATHWMMHAGQWAVVRRILGRPPLF